MDVVYELQCSIFDRWMLCTNYSVQYCPCFFNVSSFLLTFCIEIQRFRFYPEEIICKDDSAYDMRFLSRWTTKVFSTSVLKLYFLNWKIKLCNVLNVLIKHHPNATHFPTVLASNFP